MVRFRRKIRIGQGLHMNLSKSGVSFSMGIKGLSLTLGRTGAYINYGLPGTGLYNRHRIGATPRQSSGATRNSMSYARPHIPKADVIKMPKPEKITSENVLLHYSFELSLLNDGTPVMTIFDLSGAEVQDEHIERLIKRNERYRQELLQIEQEKKRSTDERNYQFIEIYKLTERPIAKEVIERKLRELKPSVYTITEFNTPKPTIEDVKQMLMEEITEKMSSSKPTLGVAKIKVTKELAARLPYPTKESVSDLLKEAALRQFPDGLFKKRDKQREEFIKNNLYSKLESEQRMWSKNYHIATANIDEVINDRYEKDLKIWNAELEEKINAAIQNNSEKRLKKEIKAWEYYRDNYDTIEADKARSENTLFLQEYEKEKSALETICYGPEDYVNTCFDEAINNIELPVEIAINYEYNQVKGLMSIDLDLPEIEDMPSEQADYDSSGHLVVKYKTDKDNYLDYEHCVFGLAFYIAGLCFNISTNISYVEISGYTQKTDIMSGGTIDAYVYSVLFDRKNFRRLDFMMIDPVMAFLSFPHIVNRQRTGELLAIDIDKPLSETCDLEQIDESQTTGIPEGCIKLESNDKNLSIRRFLDDSAYVDDRECWNEDGVSYFVVNSKSWDKAIASQKENIEKENTATLFVENNNKGIQLEKEGKIEEAILLYEQNIKTKIAASHPYDRLIILYHKLSRYADELRVVKLAVSVFPQEYKYSERLIDILLQHPELSTPVG